MNEDLEVVVEVVEAQAAALANPPMAVGELLDGLAEVGLTRSVVQVRSAIG